MSTATPKTTFRLFGFQFRPTLWATVFALPAVLLLVGLGVWQLQRLAWKEALIAHVDARLSAPAVALPATVTDTAAWDHRHVTVRGHFLHDHEIHMFAHNAHGEAGYFVITPLVRTDGGGDVLINRGWVPTNRKDPKTRAEGQVTGDVTIDGVVRLAWGQGWFTPDNDPAANMWFWLDPPAMAKAAGVTAPPLAVDAGPAANPGGLPVGGQTRVRFRNDHLQYALTWFALAIGLIAVYVIYHSRREPRDDAP